MTPDQRKLYTTGAITNEEVEVKAMDTKLDTARDTLMEVEDDLRHAARGAATVANVKLDNAANALRRARREIDAAQYYLTKA